MTDPPDQPSPIAVAMEWVSRITAVAAMMVLPGIGGQWLDARWGTGFLGLLGFVVGLVTGISYLLVMTRAKPSDGTGKGP